MFDFKYPSQYFVEVLFVIGIVSLIVMIISGVIIKGKQKRDENISKGLAKFLTASLIILFISIVYMFIFYTIADKEYSRGILIVILCSAAVFSIICKVKPKLAASKKILIFILTFVLFLAPLGILHWDGIVKEKLDKQEIEVADKIAQEVSNTEINNGLSLDKVVKASGYSYVEWSAFSSGYDDRFYITAYCKKNEDASYDEAMTFRFVYNPPTGDIELSEIRDIDGTTYRKEKAEQVFDELIEKALNNTK